MKTQTITRSIAAREEKSSGLPVRSADGMKKIIALGDTHGHETWKGIVEKEKDADKIIFIGDYFDSFYIPSKLQQENFQAIIKYKKDNPGKVILLMGNHEFHYLSEMDEAYSGYQHKEALHIEALIRPHVTDATLQMAYSIGDYLFVHAGLTSTWVKNNDIAGYPSSINDLFWKKPRAFKFSDEDKSGCGEHVSSSPIWVRPTSLKTDMFGTQTQVVGHTTFKDIQFEKNLILIDAIRSGAYLAIIDGKPEARYA